MAAVFLINRKETMPHSISEGSSPQPLQIETEPGGDDTSIRESPTQGSPTSSSSGSQGIYSHTPDGAAAAAAEGLGQGSPKIDETPINKALTGAPIQYPSKVNPGITLHPNLAVSPNLDEEDAQEGAQGAQPSGAGSSNQSSASKALGRVMGQGANLARRASSVIGKKPGSTPSVRPRDPTADDSFVRGQAVKGRERQMEEMQSNPEDRQKIRDSRGINRQKKDGTWE